LILCEFSFGYLFYRTRRSSWMFWIWFHKEGKQVLGETPLWCQIMSSSVLRRSFCQEDQDGHVDQIIMVKSVWSGWCEKANWYDLVIGHIANSASLTRLTFHPHQSDQSNQSTENANWTWPLYRSRRGDRITYVERLVWSPGEGVMVLTRTSPAPGQSDRCGTMVWPKPAA
jgi:hypothetical protein